MATKRTPKKAAAPETEVEAKVEITADGSVGTTEQAQEEAPAQEDRLGEFPLQEGHYFHPRVVSPSAHYGETVQDRGSVLALQRLLGAPETGIFDDETARLVRAWKAARGGDNSPVVDNDTWQQMRHA